MKRELQITLYENEALRCNSCQEHIIGSPSGELAFLTIDTHDELGLDSELTDIWCAKCQKKV